MNSRQFKTWLAKQGCTFEPGKSGHLGVRRGKLKSVLPMHGGRKQLGKGLVSKIKRTWACNDRPWRLQRKT